MDRGFQPRDEDYEPLTGSAPANAGLAPAVAAAASRHGNVTMVRVGQIRPGANPRQFFDETAHRELVTSIRLRGLLQPMLVRPDPEPPLPNGEPGGGAAGETRYQLVAGERRWRAAREALGLAGIVPVHVRQLSDAEALEAAIDENDVRDDASETEQADAAVRVLAACRNDRSEAAARLGWSKTKLDRRLALAGLAPEVKSALNQRRIKTGHAELLAAVPGDKQVKALETIIANRLDVSKTRDVLARMTQSLASAIFDRAECTSCPFNSAMQRSLFETAIDDGFCTNPGCYQLKTETAEKQAADTAAVNAAVRAAATRPQVSGSAPPTATTTASPRPTTPATPRTPTAQAAGTPSPAPAGGPAQGHASAAAGPATAARAAARPTTTLGSELESLRRKAEETRQAAWRASLARRLSDSPAESRLVLAYAGLSGLLIQTRPDTLRLRADRLTEAGFNQRSDVDRLAILAGTSPAQKQRIDNALAAGFVLDITGFNHVAAIAQALGHDLRSTWKVDAEWLGQWTKGDLKALAEEVGLIAAIGEKRFAALQAGKKPDMIGGLLHAPGFSWDGVLPSAMNLEPHALEPGDRVTPLLDLSLLDPDSPPAPAIITPPAPDTATLIAAPA